MIKLLHDKLSYIDRKETLRYLGAAGVDDEVLPLLDECERYILDAQALAACYSLFDISIDGEDIDLGFTRVKSRDLSRNLGGCGRIILFAATAGLNIDRLINKYTLISPARASVLQAMGSSAAEQWCDILCARFKSEFGDIRPRFSCGFGDLPLSMQRDIFAALDVTKNIGITLSDSCFMTPVKSVTAIVGIKRGKQ